MRQTQLNAIELAEAVRKRIVDFTASDFFVRDASLTDCLREMWNTENAPGNLVSDLWVEGAFPPESATDTLRSLVSAGILHPALRDTLLRNGVFGEDTSLYKHQAESLRCAREGFAQTQKPAIAVTAGTGAGKTESFLFPLLNELFRTPAQPGEGVSAIILYPMNALVNDQVERLYNWLKGQDNATLFHFTSETPENARTANNAGVPPYDACRFRTRNQARGLEDAAGNPISPSAAGPVPRILVTNYSMLEYMLCRPLDAVFFGKNLQAIVLDEAHLYTGTLAAEITLLLRRLLLRCGLGSTDVLQFATSATLGTGDLKEFIAKLFTKPSQLVHLIEGRSRRTELPATEPPAKPPTASDIAGLPWPNHPLIHADNKGDISLRRADSKELQQWQRCLAALIAEEPLQARVATCDSQPARLLHSALSASPLIHNIEQILRTKKHLPLRDLARSLFGGSGNVENDAARRLLQLCAAARESVSGQPLLGNRVHFLVRASQGFTVFFDNKKRNAGVAWGETGFTIVPGHHDRCAETGAIGLTLARCQQCGWVYFVGSETGGMLGPIPPRIKTSRKVFRCVTPGKSLSGEQQTAIKQSLIFQPITGKISGAGAEGIAMQELGKCMECFAELDQIHPFVASHNLLRNILAETMLAAMPEKPGESRLWLPAHGRRLLVFSDSRSSAARLAPSLTRQHAIQLIRAAIIRNAPQRDSDTITYLRAELETKRVDLAKAASASPGFRNTLETQIRDGEAKLAQAESGGSVSDWCAVIKDSPLVAELFDVENSDSHTFGEWQQTNWDKHRKNMISRLNFYILRELALRPSWPNISLETLGLVEVVYPNLGILSCPDSISGKLPHDIAHRFEKNWPALVASLLDTLRTDRAITLGSDAHDGLYSDDSPVPVGRWASLDESFQSGLIAFAGKIIGHRRNAFLATLLRGKTPLDDGQRDALVLYIFHAIFDQLWDAAEKKTLPWLQFAQRQTEGGAAPALRMDAAKLAFRRPIGLFQCSRTGQVWPREVECDAPATVRLDLHPIAAEKLDADPRIGRHRVELRQDPVFATGIWGEEHSAQLAPGKNRRLQDIFKAGLRNILSSTTTLELGIDIGGLHAVLMANLPPGKANYLQRAGRAGRRADGSAAVVSFIRPLPYEQAVFHNFGHFLSRPLRNPTVYLDRERIVARHWRATLLGTFFQGIHPKGKDVGTMTAYGIMGKFCKLPDVPYWERGRSGKPDLPKPGPEEKTSARFIAFLQEQAQGGQSAKWDDVIATLREGCPPTILDGTATELLTDAARVFEEAILKWEKDYDNLLKEWKSVQDNRGAANSLRYQLNILHEITVIEALADSQVLPRYGFPIGLNRLHVKVTDERRQRVREEDQFRLERSSIQALREYVPGARLMAGNRVITSHGLCKDWTGNNVDKGFGLRSQLYMCANGHSFYANQQKNESSCPLCAKPHASAPQNLLFPRNGFTTAAWDPPKYGSESEKVGQTTCQTLAFREQETGQKNDYERVTGFAGIPLFNAEWRQNAEILVTNPGNDDNGFAICTKCGYAESEKSHGKGRMNLPSAFEGHASLFASQKKPTCWRSDDKAPVLRNQILAARQNTDILLLDFSRWLQFNAQNHRAIQSAIAAAIRLAGAQMLELDLREISIMTNVPTGAEGTGQGIAIYDDTPGGSGHVRELMKIGRPWLEESYKLLRGTPEHHKSCNHGCLDCILSFDTSDSPETIRPDRRGACDMLDALLQHSEWTPPETHPASPPKVIPNAAFSQTKGERDTTIRKLKRKLELRCRKASPVGKELIQQILARLEIGTLSAQDIIALAAALRDQRPLTTLGEGIL